MCTAPAMHRGLSSILPSHPTDSLHGETIGLRPALPSHGQSPPHRGRNRGLETWDESSNMAQSGTHLRVSWPLPVTLVQRGTPAGGRGVP